MNGPAIGLLQEQAAEVNYRPVIQSKYSLGVYGFAVFYAGPVADSGIENHQVRPFAVMKYLLDRALALSSNAEVSLHPLVCRFGLFGAPRAAHGLPAKPAVVGY
jgi:hypothetical protein